MNAKEDDELAEVAALLRAERSREEQLARLAHMDLPAAARERLEKELGIPSRPSRPPELFSASSSSEREPVPSVAAQRRRKANIGVGLLIVAAASLAFWLRATEPQPQLTWTSYSLEVQGDGSPQREGSSQGVESGARPLSLREGSVLTLIAQPEQEVPGEVEVSVQLLPEAEAGSARRLEPRVEKAPGGTLRVSVELPRDLPDRGALVLTIWRPSALPAKKPPPPATSARGPGWQRMVREFHRLQP